MRHLQPTLNDGRVGQALARGALALARKREPPKRTDVWRALARGQALHVLGC